MLISYFVRILLMLCFVPFLSNFLVCVEFDEHAQGSKDAPGLGEKESSSLDPLRATAEEGPSPCH
jgi:hypothetical protein